MDIQWFPKKDNDQKLTEQKSSTDVKIVKEKFSFSQLFELRGDLDSKMTTIISIIGFILIIGLWALITSLGLIKPQLLPSPLSVLKAVPELHFHDELIRNLSYSIYLNAAGYVEAIIVSLLIGLPLGLFPFFRHLFSKQINAIRFIPLPAVTGIFMAWFGIQTNMKVQFLAVGIIVYLIPAIMQRIQDVDKIYDQTAITLGASMWQRIWHVFIPASLSKISDDVRMLVAISWTYIIVAEMINSGRGIGSLAAVASRQSHPDKVFAILIIIIIVGFVQDKLFEFIDKKSFAYKYKG
jgi:NitT/TauT family transport system permease protein